jgi:hypothetical protein
MAGGLYFYGKIDDVFAFPIGANDTSGSGDDGASPTAYIRKVGDAAGVAPIHEPTPILLTHANYPAGAYALEITASIANGYANGEKYLVYSSLTVDAQNPTGALGGFELSVDGGIALRGSDDDNLKDLSDQIDAIPTDAMRGTDGANTTTPPTTASVADAVLEELVSDHIGTAGSLADLVDRVLDNTRILSFRKNTALNNWMFTIRDTSGAPLTGRTVTPTRILDSGSEQSMANAVSEVGSTAVYRIDISAADTNGDTGAFIFTPNAGLARTITFRTTDQ